ncbi:ATP-grasp fold amidoligase family protein [Rariglobus hedericola]|uniref:Glycosyl transferase n=1 Tax=Rariglobus hedericola TaxID=2597822 RepID=A0A556QJ49_9BACT|nr:ATP-grasp fold amidoligase family protein [Rariglobus hedericola]TSJ76670.1 glycosyl transferase [Rariglobus hedericola]
MNKIDVIKAHFRAALRYELNLREPKSYNEKIQWLKLFYQDPLLTRCADKIAVKDHVREKLGRDICIPTLAAYRTVEDFRIEDLPDQFVLKLNSGSGQMLICADKKSFDFDAAHARIATWLEPASNHYFFGHEWAYKNIQPGVIAEQLLGNGEPLRNYKFICFNGEPNCLYTTVQLGGKLYVDFYDFEWNHLPFDLLDYPNSPQPPLRPDKLEEMICISKILAKDFPFVRVDLYCIESRVFFGELTFYPSNGTVSFDPQKADYDLGALLTLPDHAVLLPDENKPPIKVSLDALHELCDLTDHLPPSPHAHVDVEMAHLVDKIERMQKSYSWRLTAPFRFLRRLFYRPPVTLKSAH